MSADTGTGHNPHGDRARWCVQVINPGCGRRLPGNGEGRCPADAGGLRLLFPVGPRGRVGDAPTPAWEAPNPSVLLKENTEKRFSWESGSERGKNCSNPPQKLCVKARGRAAACVNCCGYAKIMGFWLPTSTWRWPRKEGSARTARLTKARASLHHLSARPDLPLVFLPPWPLPVPLGASPGAQTSACGAGDVVQMSAVGCAVPRLTGGDLPWWGRAFS